MQFREIISMALQSLGANKLRSGLTMIGITIGVFSVISVMTAIGALQSSIEGGISFLGSNIFQFAKYPVGGGQGGRNQNKFENRRNITYQQALRLQATDGRATRRRFASRSSMGAARPFTTASRQRPALPSSARTRAFSRLTATRSLTAAISPPKTSTFREPSRLIGKEVEKRLFPHESPIGKVIKLNGHNVTVIGVLGEKGTAFGQSQDDLCVLPITRFFENFGSAKRSINVATQSFSQQTYNRTLDRAIGAMRIARGLKPHEENDFEIYSNDSLKSAFTSIAGVVRIGAFVISIDRAASPPASAS